MFDLVILSSLRADIGGAKFGIVLSEPFRLMALFCHDVLETVDIGRRDISSHDVS
jgi:hypothetical protein